MPLNLSQAFLDLERKSNVILNVCRQVEGRTSKSKRHGTLNRTLLVRHSNIIISALQDVLNYDPRRSNRPPPELWLDDGAYLVEIKKLIFELRRFNRLLESNRAATKTIINLYKHFDHFLEKFAASLGSSLGSNIGRGLGVGIGAGSAALLIGSVGALFHYAGMGENMVAHLLEYWKTVN